MDSWQLYFYGGVLLLFLVLAGARLLLGKPYLNRLSAKWPDSIREAGTLLRDNTYYRKLSDTGKTEFVSRCLRFALTKRFIGREGLEVTFEMQIKIAAAAIQVTFGHRKFDLAHFHTIQIYPGTFYSGLHSGFLKGGASTRGTIFISWADFEAGFADPADRYNLGIHEIAHALKLNLLHGTDFDDRFANYLEHWDAVARLEFEQMQHGSKGFLREYGASNMEEFFAVSVEHFFEVPEAFKEQLPDLYNHLCFLLNQDPSDPENDFRLPDDFADRVNAQPDRIPIEKKPATAYQYHNWHWSFNLIVGGLFVCTPALFLLHGTVLFSGKDVLLFFLAVIAVVSGLRTFFFRKGIFQYGHLLMFATVGLAPLLFTLALVTNMVVAGPEVKEKYEVSGFVVKVVREGEIKKRYYQFYLRNTDLDRYKSVATLPAAAVDQNLLKQDMTLEIRLSRGCWGWQNFNGSRLLPRS